MSLSRIWTQEKYVQKYLFICIPLCFEMRSYQILIIFVNKIPGQNQSNFWHLTIFHVILKRNGLYIMSILILEGRENLLKILPNLATSHSSKPLIGKCPNNIESLGSSIYHPGGNKCVGPAEPTCKLTSQSTEVPVENNST